MANLENTWVGYITRSFQQIKAAILAKLPAEAPEITDHTENNILIRIINIWSGLIEMLGYYTDNAAREAHLPTARLLSTGVKIARMHDYRVKGRLAASVDLTFTLSAPAPSLITIPAGTEVQNSDGIPFFTDVVATIAIGLSEAVVGATQKVQVTGIAIGTSDGSPNQSFALDSTILDSSLDVKVNAINWNSVDSFALSLAVAEDFVGRLNEISQLEINFSDGINGAIPANGLDITADYFITEGDVGNVGNSTLTTLIGAVTLPSGFTLAVNNDVRASGGVATESLESIQRRLPLSIRTLYRAVTEQDFKDVAVLSPGVAQAGLLFECGKRVDLFIAPEGGGIASQILLDDTQIFIDLRRMVTVEVNVLPAGEVRMLITAQVAVLSNFSRATTEQLVKDNLETFLAVDNQLVFGSVKLGDIYEVIENTEGVDNSEVSILSTVPYARPIDHDTVLDWTRELLASSTVSTRWTIQMVTTTTFQILKGNQFVSIGTVGIEVVTAEIQFTVNASTYSIGEKWEFYTYPFFGTVNLLEPSVPVGLQTDFTIISTGGI